jgi:hypothetical protein
MDTEEDKEDYTPLEQWLGLPETFILRLREEGNDWEFIIKAHALIETALTEVLVHRLGHPELEELVGRLPINGFASKLTFSQALGIFRVPGRVDEKFIISLGEIRNRLVHNIKRGVSFALVDYLRDLDITDKDAFDKVCRELTRSTAEEARAASFEEDDGSPLTLRDLFKRAPRYFIFAGVVLTLDWLHSMLGWVQAKADLQRRADDLLDKIAAIASIPPANAPSGTGNS